MARRRNDRPRVLGPTWIPSCNYYRVTTIDPKGDGGAGRRMRRYFGSVEEANDWKNMIEARLPLLDRHADDCICPACRRERRS